MQILTNTEACSISHHGLLSVIVTIQGFHTKFYFQQNKDGVKTWMVLKCWSLSFT